MTTIHPTEHLSPALERFLKSMNIGFIEWHDGVGYDLNALKELAPAEITYVESILVYRKDSDWRDIEALAALATPRTIQALKDCLTSHNNDCRLFAVRLLNEMDIIDRVEEVVIDTLPRTKIGEGLTYALTLAKTRPSERMKNTILRCALDGNDDIRIHCTALAFYMFWITAEEFDISQTIQFEFRETDRSRRITAFKKLCEMVAVDPSPFITR